jgi:hypothetical protein
MRTVLLFFSCAFGFSNEFPKDFHSPARIPQLPFVFFALQSVAVANKFSSQLCSMKYRAWATIS